MRQSRSVLSFLWVLVILMLVTGSAAAQDQPSTSTSTTTKTETQITLNEPSWQAVLDKLFGTPDNGLVDGAKAFQLRAEDVTLTADQSAAFFNSSSTSSQDLAALIDAAIALKGQVRMDGTIDGKPFELKLAGRELKLDGITLTTAQREAFSAELLGISGLREAKIGALVDGKQTMIVVAGGKERISLVRGERPENARGDEKQKLDLPAKIDLEHRTDVKNRVEIDRGVRADTRVEHEGRIGGRVEKPELPRLGK
jgi:hypothetical protein